MSDITFELFETEFDESSVLECKFGQYIVGEKGDKGDKGETGEQGELTPEDTALLAAYTAAAAGSANKAQTSADNAANSAAAAASTAAQAATQTQQAVKDAQAAATSASGSATQSSASASAAAGSQTAAAASATQAASSATAATGSANNARDWATKTDGLVQNIDYSAKWYAQQSGGYANAAAGSASAAAGSASQAAGSAAAAAGSAQDAANSAASIDTSTFVALDGSRAMTAPLQTTGLNVQGASRRIVGDYSAVAQAARVLFQTSGANSGTSVGAIPNGSGPGANFIAYALPDASNSPYMQFGSNSTVSTINVYATGTGTPGPFNLNVGGALRYSISAAGLHTLAGGSVNVSGGPVILSGASSGASVQFSPGGGLRYFLGWDSANFTLNRYNGSGTFLNTSFYVRDTDGAFFFGVPVTASSIVTTALTVASGITCTGNSIELGPAAAGPAYIDLHSSGTGSDYDARIISTGGNATVGQGTLDLYGGVIDLRAAGAYVNIYGSSTYATLRLWAGGYGPSMRSSAGNSSMEWINSANSAVNLTLSDAGVLTSRGAMTATGGLNTPGANCYGTLWMQSANSIRLDGGGYSGFLRGDTSGLVGFINQAQNAWTMQIKDSGYVKAINGFVWGDDSNIGGQWNGTGSIGGHTESNAVVQNSNNVNLILGHTGGGGTLESFYVAGANVGSISASTSVTSYNTTSDYRLKTNIEDLTGGLDRVLQMHPVAFDWKVSGQPDRGFIAHELEPIEPSAVTGVKDAMMQDRGNPEGPEVPAYQQVDLSFCIPDMVAAMQELKSQLDAALARIATLEGAAAA